MASQTFTNKTKYKYHFPFIILTKFFWLRGMIYVIYYFTFLFIQFSSMDHVIILKVITKVSTKRLCFELNLINICTFYRKLLAERTTIFQLILALISRSFRQFFSDLIHSLDKFNRCFPQNVNSYLPKKSRFSNLQ